MSAIQVRVTKEPRGLPDESSLGFGIHFSDHMFLSNYSLKQGWHSGRIEPYGPLSFSPGVSVFHYCQAVFEGMKAFRGTDGKIRVFRMAYHAERMAGAAARLCMPFPGSDVFIDSLKNLLKVDQRWVPAKRGTALYLRPLLIATEEFLGVRPSNEYLFAVISSPVGAYYTSGLSPVKIWVEKEFVRACAGGIGAIKAGANYASSLQAFERAKKLGYSQVLWLDSQERKYVEEVGTMNIFFLKGNTLITPPLGGTILNGATRDCVIQLAKHWGVTVEERSISIDEVFADLRAGRMHEVFGTGTAAVISAVGELATSLESITIGQGKIGSFTQRLYDEITAIQYGEKVDQWGWTTIVD